MTPLLSATHSLAMSLTLPSKKCPFLRLAVHRAIGDSHLAAWIDFMRSSRRRRGRHKNADTIKIPLWFSMYSAHAHNMGVRSIMTLHHNNDKNSAA